MSNYMSRAEIEEISEGLIQLYATKHSGKVVHYIDIEHFITEFLSLKIEYAAFAEDDGGKIGFLADGETPLLIHQDGKISPFIFPKDTIVLDKLLLSEKEQGRRRFTMAHEAAHHILSKMYDVSGAGRFHTEYDNERSYSREELAQMRNLRYGHTFDINDGEFEEHHPEMAVETDPIEEIILQDNIQKLRQVLCNLSEKQKQRVIQYFFYGKTFKQIADEEGLSAPTIKESIDSAIKKLKKFF